MDLGIAVLLVIIIIDLIAVYYVFRIGVQHDPHHAQRDADSAESVKLLRQREEDRQAKVAARDAALAAQVTASSESADGEGAKSAESGADTENKVSSALGDEEARRKRREEALKRKAARQAARAESSS